MPFIFAEPEPLLGLLSLAYHGGKAIYNEVKCNWRCEDDVSRKVFINFKSIKDGEVSEDYKFTMRNIKYSPEVIARKVRDRGFDTSLPTKIFAHGWKQKGDDFCHYYIDGNYYF